VSFLDANGLGLPEGYTREDLVTLASFYIQVAMGICAPDYEREIAATIEFVRAGLNSHSISY
jgi:hypothetical protein